MPTLKVCTGFEHGVSDLTSLTKGNAGNKLFDAAAGSPTMQSSAPVRSGTYALELNPSAATEYVEWTTDTLGASLTSVVVGFAFRFVGALPSNDAVLVYMTTSTSEDRVLYFRNSDDKLVVSDHTFSTTTAGPTIAADTWYYVDLRFTISGTSHITDWQVDGTAQTQQSDTVASGNITAVALGDRFNTSTMTCRYDDVAASTTSGDYPLGAHKVVLIKPDTGGTTAEIGTANATGRMVTNSAIDATHNSANILTATSEVPPLIGASATGVGQRTSGAGNAVGIPMTTYTLGGGETLSGLRILVVGWAGSATAASIGLRTFNGTTETTLFAAADPNFDNNTTSPAWLCKMATAADFDTQSELGALVVRLGYSTDISPLPGAHAIYGEVAVKESAGGATASLDQATETDSAFTPTFTKTGTLGQSTETDSALGATLVKAKPLEQATETDSAQTLTAVKVATLGLSTETDSALGVTVTKVVTLGLATETDTAFTAAFGATLAVELGQATETDTAQGLTANKALTLGLPTETDSSSSASFTKTVILGLATEADAALGATAGAAASFNLSQALETDTALSLSFARAVTLGIAAEIEAAAGLAFAKVITLGLATETDTAFEIELVGATASAYSIALVVETRSGVAATSAKRTSITGVSGQTSTATVSERTTSN